MLALAAPPPALPAVKVSTEWVVTARATRVGSLSLGGVPAAARVTLRCRGAGCPFASKAVPTHRARKVSLTRALKGARLRPGAHLDVRVSDATGTLVVRFTMRSGRAPAKQRTWLSVAEQPPPSPAPGPPAPGPGQPPGSPAPGRPGVTKGQQALDVAKLYAGTPFVYGGASPQTGFDDAGLVQYAYGQAGVALPRVASDQCQAGTAVARADLLPGDVVCFDDGTGYIGHVGLYAGDGQFLHAPHTGAVIGYNALTEPYYSARFSGGRRFG
jgi:cell wall-associated NlpC family hydrolase